MEEKAEKGVIGKLLDIRTRVLLLAPLSPLATVGAARADWEYKL